jgi:signal transduction histidine kinase
LVSSTILGSYLLDEKNKKAAHYKPNGFPEILNSISITPNNGIFLSHNLQLQWWKDGKKVQPFPIFRTIGASPISTQDSLYLILNGNLYVIREHNSLHPLLSNLSINIGTALPDGSLILVDDGKILKYNPKSQTTTSIKKIPETTITCITADERRWYLGTDDRGLLIYDLLQDNLMSLDQKKGLSCNYVYNLLIDDEGKIWAGTGCGIDKLSFSSYGQFTIRSYGPSDGLIGAESNANASYQDSTGKLWFGTTKGLFQLDREKERKHKITPFVILNELHLFSTTIEPKQFSDSTIPFTNLPYKPKFKHNQNSLSFAYRAICLSAPDKITYKYKLEGIDKEFVETKITTVAYNQLNPGTYTFIVYASDEDGNWHDNAFTYSFTIEAVFYQTIWFKIIAFSLLISGVAYVIYRYSSQKELQRQRDMRLREEEQNKVRQRTAQDFHDEIGNKITRINLLTMMAEKKAGNNTDVQAVLQQIRQNTQSLYHGSKDIIWALQKESQYLKEALLRIQQNAIALLNETGIKLIIEEEPPIQEDIQMPLDYGRNLTLIFKEAINNAIKYSQATQLILRFYEDIDNSIVLELEDNGIGFDTDNANAGNGLDNMQHRAQAIKGKFTIHSLAGIGTLIRLRLFHYSFEA